MPEYVESAAAVPRRRFIARCLVALHAAIGSTLTFILGRAALGPSLQGRSTVWLHAAALDALPDAGPLQVMLRVARPDGSAHVIERTTVYLVRSGESTVRAMHSTCTHLGCRTSYDATTKRILCPCHGGIYDVDGQVIAGPPPAPLAALPTRIENGQILVAI